MTKLDELKLKCDGMTADLINVVQKLCDKSQTDAQKIANLIAFRKILISMPLDELKAEIDKNGK